MRHFSIPAVIAAFVVATAAACGVADPPSAQQAAALREKVGSALFEQNARPYGFSMERWSELLWRWIYRQPPHFVGERSCTIPRHTALLVQTAVFLNDYHLTVQ